MKLQSLFLICVAAIIALGVAAAIVFMPQRESALAFDPSAPLPVRVEQVASTRMAELGRVPGLVIGVQIGDTEPVTLALGVADEESGDSMTVNHVFRVASATKPMLGAVALKLAEEGVIDLDATIDKYLPDVPEGDRVTVRMLGNNSAGYFNAIASEAFRAAINAEPDRLWTAQEILGFALAEPMTLEAPGEGWSYSNTNSVVLGEVIRAATGEHWLAALRRLVIEPLALDSVGVEEGGLGVDGVAPAGLPSGYRYARRDSGIQYGNVFIDATAYSSSWAGASGSMYADVHDLLKSAEAVL
ncbi:MAG: serine hydrolase domain-containing protein, partial [Pseudomonadota bacterium]